jgi:hypothetical protein
MEDTARVVVTVLLAAFVIERITAALMFFSETPKGPERTRKIYRIVIAAILGAVAVWIAHIRLLSRLSTTAPEWLDAVLSWLVLVGGADRIRDFIAPGGGGGGGEKKPELPPIQFIIEDKDGNTTVQQFHAS